MSDNPNKLSQFWQELKRRRVVRVIAMYAATAFIIMEAGDIMLPRLGLPDWTVTFIIILLIVGFPITIILSWIFDITPEGLKKTESIKVATEKETVAKPVKRKLRVSDVIIAVLLVAVVILVYPKIFQKEKFEDITELEKSIAVLPFKSLSDDPEKQYLADGTMDAILLHLSKIEDLRVMARTSVEQYRETDKTANMIFQELDVTYLLEGSFQKYGDQARLIVQLITPGKEDHIWAKEFDRNWEDIFSVQSEVAQAIARELMAVITPEEKLLIEKVPTTNLTAYDFYQRGRDEHSKYLFENEKGVLEVVENLYYKALEYDSTFAQAYAGLALVYYNKHYWGTFLSENFLDSVLILADIALSYDDQLAEAYTVRGDYYTAKGRTEQAIKEYDKAIKFNPNDWMAYRGKGYLYTVKNDIVKKIDNYQKAASVNHGSEFPIFLRSLSGSYLQAGFTEKAIYYE
jgi:TolB-like protein